MNELMKAGLVGLLTVFFTVYLKPYRPEYALAVSLCGGAVVALMLCRQAVGTFSSVRGLLNDMGIAGESLSVAFKAVGIGYLAESAAAVANDNGQSALALKITLAGKIALLILALPMLNTLCRLAVSFVK